MKTGFKVISAVLVSILFSGCASSPAPLAGAKPNIIYILADDLGWSELGCYGNKFNETPNLDRLADQGMLFTNAYAAAPVCSPYRAALMSGQSPVRLGITDYLRPDSDKHLPEEMVTLAEMLKEAGYVTGMTGKWHLSGYDDEGVKSGPAEHGFDEVMISEKRGIGYGSYFHPYDRIDKSIEPVLSKDEYLTDRLNYEAVRFIERHSHEPFFLYKSHYSVHTRLKGKPQLAEYFADKPQAGKSRNNPHLAAMLKSIDDGVGMIVDKLEAEGIADNTLIIFTSDNGGELKVTTNAPLREGKSHLYEGGIREPMIACWPDIIKGGSFCNTPVSNYDFYPTFTALAGAPEPGHPQDGTSLVPLLAGKDIEKRPLYWHYPMGKPHNLGGRSSGAVRYGDWKLIELFDTGKAELYNLSHDIGEKVDLSEEFPYKVRQLHSMLKDWRKDAGAEIPEGQKTSTIPMAQVED